MPGCRSDPPDRPRERLDALGSSALSDAELVALLLRTGNRGSSALAVATDLLGRHGGLQGLSRVSGRELGRSQGIGPAKSASMRAALEVGRRLAGRRLRAGAVIRSPSDVYHHFHPSLRDARQEHFLVILLDARHRVLRSEMISQGTLTASLVHPREVFRPALRDAAAALVHLGRHDGVLPWNVNVCSGISVSVRDVAGRILDLVRGSRSALAFSGARRAGDPVRWVCRPTTLEATGFRATTALDVGLARTVDWYRATLGVVSAADATPFER
ncbi:MAG: hypothetical protein IH974_12025 [Myxococcales bacterium]|nr:hypothetical protein [Myxococcales bacterium]